MRPGYTLLLEFGWSVYLDNNGNLTQYDGFSSPALRSLFKASGINQYDIMGEISKERVANPAKAPKRRLINSIQVCTGLKIA